MRRTFSVIVIFSFFIFNTYAQQGWVAQNSGTTFTGFYDVKLLDANTGIVVGYYPDGYGKVYRTTNQGSSWSNVYTTQNPLHQIEAVSFGNANTGIAVGGAIFNGPPVVFRSTNAGLTWLMLTPPAGNYLFDIKMIDSDTAYAVGYTGTILKTTNSGTGWTAQASGTSEHLKCVHFIDFNTGFAAGTNGVALRTTNRGTNWAPLTTGTSQQLNDIYFLNLNTGFVAGNNGLILRTTNSGLSWTQQNSNVSVSLLAIANVNVNYCTITGASGIILRTTNTGLNWFTQTSGTTQTLRGVAFTDTSNGTAVGDQGTILHTTNGGITLIGKLSEEIPKQFSLEQNYPNPFNPVTNFGFRIANLEFVNIVVYSSLGEKVITLVNEKMSPGSYVLNFDGSRFASGIYFYIMNTDSFTDTKKMILLK